MFDLDFAKNLRVLYIEDEEYAREAGRLLLERFFKEVDVAADGEEGLKKFNQKDYDIVITDLTMPKIDGIELIKRIKKIVPHQEIIVLTAHNDKDYLLDTINLHVSGYLLKPIDGEQLFSVLDKVIKSIKVLKEHEELEHILEAKVQEKIEEIKKLLYYDKNTNLPNFTSLKQVILQRKCNNLAVVDISNFKKINAVFGIEIGDKVLRRLKEYLIEDYKEIYKLPEAAFAILLDKDFDALCKKLNNFVFKEDSLVLRFTFKTYFIECYDFIKNYYLLNSFLAEKKIKRLCKYFSKEEISSLYELQLDHQGWINRVIEAIEKDRIVPFYQPIINNKTLRAEKYEALIRMKIDDEYVSPFFFLIPAKDAGIVQELTKIMVNKTFKDAKEYNIAISLNITQQDIGDDKFLEFLIKKRKEFDIPASSITLEVLEDIDTFSNESLSRVKELKKEGFLIAIDDFGSGYSNFQRVIDINPDFIKIDGSLIKNIEEKSFFATIKAIKNFAKSINSKVVAEFVENEKIFELVTYLDIEYSQGYYFSPPKLIKDIKDGNF